MLYVFVFINGKNGSCLYKYKKNITGTIVQEAEMKGKISYVRSLGREQAKEIRASQSTYKNIESQSWVKITRIKSKTGHEVKWRLVRKSNGIPGNAKNLSFKHPWLPFSDWYVYGLLAHQIRWNIDAGYTCYITNSTSVANIILSVFFRSFSQVPK